MHSLICGFVLAVMALFPGSAGEGGLNLRAWMEAYETRLYAQMEANLERERNEQATVEEIQTEAPVTNSGGMDSDHEVEQGRGQGVVEVIPAVDAEQTATVAAEVKSPEPVYPLYAVNGAVLDEEIQLYLFQRLTEQNIAYFMPYAMMIMYQESKLDIYAENPNGRDKGLLQYRVEYVPWMDWRNPYQQIDYFVAQMANRAAAGCTVSEMISRHNTSDYGSYNQSYVDAVMQHSNTLARVR